MFLTRSMHMFNLMAAGYIKLRVKIMCYEQNKKK